MLWKFSDTLLLKSPKFLHSTTGCVSNYPIDTPVVYLASFGHYAVIVLQEVFDEKSEKAKKRKKWRIKQLYGLFKGQTNIIPNKHLYSPDLKKEGFKYLL